MPANIVVVNGQLKFVVPDSWMDEILSHLAPWSEHVEAANFEIQAADDCVWLRDIRQGPPLEIHMTRAQAREVGLALSAIGSSRRNVEMRW